MGRAGKKLSCCERAVSGRREKYPSSMKENKSSRAAEKTAGHKVKRAERVGPAAEKLSRCERPEAELAGPRAAGVLFRSAH